MRFTDVLLRFALLLLLPAAQAQPAPRIESFVTIPVASLRPGRELRFVVTGTPAAQARVELPGIGASVPLKESLAGFYQGMYRVREGDDPAAFALAIATLQLGEARASHRNARAFPLPTEPDVMEIRGVRPREGEVVAGGGSTQLAASFESSHGGNAVRPDSVRVFVSGRDVTAGAQVSASAVTLQLPLAAGTHDVEVRALDAAGQVVSRRWRFEVAAAPKRE